MPKKASTPMSATVPFTLEMIGAFKLLIGAITSPSKNKIMIKKQKKVWVAVCIKAKTVMSIFFAIAIFCFVNHTKTSH